MTAIAMACLLALSTSLAVFVVLRSPVLSISQPLRLGHACIAFHGATLALACLLDPSPLVYLASSTYIASTLGIALAWLAR